MTNLYVRSTDGSDADNGTTWALAKATIGGAAAIDSAGDVIYISQAHAESSSGAAMAWAGTLASPVKILCGNDGAAPPTALAATASITITGSGFTGWSGSTYAYGLPIIFTSASSISMDFNSTTGHFEIFDTCKFRAGTGAGSVFTFGVSAAAGASYTALKNCGFKMGNAGQRIGVSRELVIEGGAWESGGTSPTGIFTLGYANRMSYLTVSGYDFSNCATGVNLVQTIADGGGRAVFRDCKLPASWSGALVASGGTTVGSRVDMINCDAGDTNYRRWVEDYAGTIKSETTVVKTSGASDGTTPLSWKMVTVANAEYPVIHLLSPEMLLWNETTGSSVTVTVDVVTDNVTLKDDECWLEVMYLGTSGFPLGSWITDCKADVLATAADQTTSTATWTTTGLTTPVKQKLSVTFTPQEKGQILARVAVAKASTTVYADQWPTVS